MNRSLTLDAGLALSPQAVENTASTPDTLPDHIGQIEELPCTNGEQMRGHATRLLSDLSANKNLTIEVGRLIMERNAAGEYTQTPESVRERLITQLGTALRTSAHFFALREAGTAVRGVYAKGDKTFTAVKVAESIAGTEAEVLKVIKKG